MVAFVDESYKRFGNTELNHYAFAAVVVEDEYCGDLRDLLHGLLLRGQRELHWRNESQERQHRIIETLRALQLQIVYVCRVPPRGEAQERSRALCLERLLPELRARQQLSVVADARQSRLDKNDLDVLQHLRNKGWLPSDLRLLHKGGDEESLLWAADIACGALSDDADGRWHLNRLRSGLIDVHMLVA